MTYIELSQGPVDLLAVESDCVVLSTVSHCQLVLASDGAHWELSVRYKPKMISFRQTFDSKVCVQSALKSSI